MVRLRAEGRRLALTRNAEKGGPEDLEARRAQGRALLKCVFLLSCLWAGADERGRERATLVSQLTLDCLDFWIPATNLGYASLNDGAIGAIG
jgi:peroxin-11B